MKYGKHGQQWLTPYPIFIAQRQQVKHSPEIAGCLALIQIAGIIVIGGALFTAFVYVCAIFS